MKKKKYTEEYDKYKDIPEDKNERLQYIYELLKVKDKDINKINRLREEILENKRNNANKLSLVFYIIPEGISRPRKGKYGFYVPNIQKFYDCMNDYLKIHSELADINIFTECKIDLKYYLPIPSSMNKIEKILAEMKLIRHVKKPDWDNLGKSSDMFKKLWLDDCLVTDARVRKFYSFKPRIEVNILYYNDNYNTFNKKCIEKIIKKNKG